MQHTPHEKNDASQTGKFSTVESVLKPNRLTAKMNFATA